MTEQQLMLLKSLKFIHFFHTYPLKGFRKKITQWQSNTSVVQFYAFSPNHYNPTVGLKHVQLSEDFMTINIMALKETNCYNVK